MQKINLSQDDIEKLEKLERLGELAQEKDRAETRQRQILSEIEHKALKSFLVPQDKNSVWSGTAAKWALGILFPVFLAAFGTYFVSSPVYYADKSNWQKELIDHKFQITDGLSNVQKPIISLQESNKSTQEILQKQSEIISQIKESLVAIKVQLDGNSNRINRLENAK